MNCFCPLSIWCDWNVIPSIAFLCPQEYDKYDTLHHEFWKALLEVADHELREAKQRDEVRACGSKANSVFGTNLPFHLNRSWKGGLASRNGALLLACAGRKTGSDERMWGVGA